MNKKPMYENLVCIKCN